MIVATGGLSVPNTGSDGAGLSMLRAMGHGAGVAAIADLYRGLASTLVVARGDVPPPAVVRGSRLKFVEDDILLLDPAKAESLARRLLLLSRPARRTTS